MSNGDARVFGNGELLQIALVADRPERGSERRLRFLGARHFWTVSHRSPPYLCFTTSYATVLKLRQKAPPRCANSRGHGTGGISSHAPAMYSGRRRRACGP